MLTLTCASPKPASAQHPSWINSAVIYGVYPDIFSANGNFAGVTAQINRIRGMGCNVLWIMPVTPIGQPINGHPSIGSPYCVHDYYGINPSFGGSSDLHALINAAHSAGMKVILDEVLNHTSWDNALITQHPEYYVHSDGNAGNPNSIVQAGSWPDVAQLNYASSGLRGYMTSMLQWWITNYGVDGFRFDTADYPGGSNRNIPKSYWTSLRSSLESVKSDILMLGECESTDLALAPFECDYGWWLHDNMVNVAGGASAMNLQTTWQAQANQFPVGMMHMNIQDDWDYARDVNVLNGMAGAMDAAVMNFTISGIPLLYNGMEVANNAGGVNTHAKINWNFGTPFPQFYSQLIALRQSHPVLQQGGTVWRANSASGQVLTYSRTGGEELLIEINESGSAVGGTISGLPTGWTEVTPSGAPGGQSHTSPPNFSLQAHDFAIFKH